MPKVTREDWLKRAPNAGAALQGRIEGPRAFRSSHAPWRVLARVDHTDLSDALKQAEEDLACGVDGLVLTPPHLVPILKDLPLHKIAIFNEAGEAGAEAIAALIGTLPLDPQRLNIDFGSAKPELIERLITQGFTGPFMRADGRVGHAHGLTDAQELGATLSIAKSRLQTLAALKSQAVSITLAVAQNPFATLAKFRAARILWKQLLVDLKMPDAQLALHAETSRMMMADIDAHTNILRAVTAVFGAGLGAASPETRN
jgi:methylmalonyl-CoA mutase